MGQKHARHEPGQYHRKHCHDNQIMAARGEVIVIRTVLQVNDRLRVNQIL